MLQLEGSDIHLRRHHVRKGHGRQASSDRPASLLKVIAGRAQAALRRCSRGGFFTIGAIAGEGEPKIGIWSTLLWDLPSVRSAASRRT